jgi:tRNA pseudouridine32 synthase/23S rRNA pseudouridine746 synthase
MDLAPLNWHGGGMILADRVLFLDGEAIILDKPAGLPVDRPRDGTLSLENFLASLTFGFKRWPAAVHRLDRDTSGCLLLARNPKALGRFGQAFEQRRVGKRYFAVVEGQPEGDEGVIDLPLFKVSSEANGWRMIGDDRGKPAVTRWKVIARKEHRALVQFEPETGRTHQIRAHAAYGLKCPVAGDPIYASHLPKSEDPMLLHSAWLRIERDGKPPIEAEAPLPDSFAKAGFAL